MYDYSIIILTLTVSVCLCSVIANVALIHSILEHQTCGSVGGVGGQVGNKLSTGIINTLYCVDVADVLFGSESAVHCSMGQFRLWLSADV